VRLGKSENARGAEADISMRQKPVAIDGTELHVSILREIADHAERRLATAGEA